MWGFLIRHPLWLVAAGFGIVLCAAVRQWRGVGDAIFADPRARRRITKSMRIAFADKRSCRHAAEWITPISRRPAGTRGSLRYVETTVISSHNEASPCIMRKSPIGDSGHKRESGGGDKSHLKGDDFIMMATG